MTGWQTPPVSSARLEVRLQSPRGYKARGGARRHPLGSTLAGKALHSVLHPAGPIPVGAQRVTGWESPGGPASRLAASHLQGPKSFMQLDHLLSLVPTSYPDVTGVLHIANDWAGQEGPSSPIQRRSAARATVVAIHIGLARLETQTHVEPVGLCARRSRSEVDGACSHLFCTCNGRAH